MPERAGRRRPAGETWQRVALAVACSLPILAGLIVAAPAVGQDRGSMEEMRREKRVALVIGNAAYAAGRLNNPINDARAMVASLRALGFEVMAREDLGNVAMRRAAAEFGEKLVAGGVGLFYYSGHGIQVNGRNYLIPIDADIRSERYVAVETLDVDSVLGQMDAAKNRLNIVILDACRDNPFARRFRSMQRGLASMDVPAGTYIAYATSPNSVADDGPPGRNGLYTGELLKTMQQPGLRIEEVFKRVRQAVIARTSGRQNPWDASSLTGDFFFAMPGAPPAPPPPPPPSRPTVREEATGEVGTLVIRGTVPGAQIWVGGERIGETRPGRALVVEKLLAGQHFVKATKAGHKDWEREVTVVADQRTEVVIDIEPLRSDPPPPADPRPPADSRTITWRLQSTWPEGSMFHEGARRLASAVGDLTGGQLKISVLRAGTVAPNFQVFDAVAKGAVEAGYATPSYWIGKWRWAALFAGIPFGLSAEDMTAWLKRGGGLALQRELYARHGVVPVPAGTSGEQMAGWTRRPIRSPADLHGLKIRTVGLTIDFLRGAGAAVVVLTLEEILPALQRNIIDAAAHSGPAEDMRLGLHQIPGIAYYRPAGWLPPAVAFELLVNKPTWDALPAHLQRAVEEAGQRTTKWMSTEMAARNAKALTELRDVHRVPIMDLPESVLGVLRQSTTGALDGYAQADPDFRRVYEALQQFRRVARP